MAHNLYQQALDGIPKEVSKTLEHISGLLAKGHIEEAQEKLLALSKLKLRNLSVAQRTLWNLSCMAGIGHRVTLDLSGAGVTLTPPTVPALPPKSDE